VSAFIYILLAVAAWRLVARKPKPDPMAGRLVARGAGCHDGDDPTARWQETGRLMEAYRDEMIRAEALAKGRDHLAMYRTAEILK
jgi:hypothetical protein